MAEVFATARSGVQVVGFSHDHCPPHVSALKRRDDWIARIGFSFVTDAVALWDIEPVRNAPRRREVEALLDAVQDRLAECRRVWWMIQRTTCLEGRLAQPAQADLGNAFVLLAKRRPKARQVSAATYDLATRDLLIAFRDGSTVTMRAGTGEEL